MHSARQKGAEPTQDPANELSFDDSVMPRRHSRSGEEEFDPLTQVASEETLGERLMADLGAILAPEDMPIAEYLVQSLDDKGYLSTSIDEAAYELDVDERRVRNVLRQLQGLEKRWASGRATCANACSSSSTIWSSSASSSRTLGRSSPTTWSSWASTSSGGLRTS